MMRINKWKWHTLHFVLVITFFSCAGRSSAPEPAEQSQQRALSTTTSIRENPNAQSNRSDSKLPESAEPSEPPAKNREKLLEKDLPDNITKTKHRATRLTSVTARPLDKNVVINVKANGEISNYDLLTLDNPPRIIIDMFNLKSPYSGEQRIAVKSKWVSRIRHFSYPDKIRMVLETNKAYLSKILAVPIDNGLLVYVGSIPASAGKQRSKPVAVRNETYSDYRSKAFPTKLNEQTPDRAALGKDDVGLNFDNADVKEVIAAIAELTGIKYIVDPGIEGQVTIHTAGGVTKENLLSVFYLILEVNGLTAVKDGEFYRITTIDDASRLPVALRFQTAGRPYVRQEEIITQIIALHYISAEEMSKLLKPFLSTNGTIISHEGSNTLLVVDTGINIMKALKLVEAFDIGLFEKTNHRFFFLKNADAGDVTKILNEVFASTLKGRSEGVKFIPIARLNACLALSPDTRMFNKIHQLLLNLDSATQGIEPRIYVYFVKNGSALDLANLLNLVFSESITTGDGQKRQSSSPLPQKPSFGQMQVRQPVTAPGLIIQGGVSTPSTPGVTIQEGVKSPPATSAPTAPAPKEAISETSTESTSLKGVIKITPDEIRNALIIEATPADYRVILNVLKTIDVLPRQVLIEATIAEIDYSLVTDLGVNWEYLKGANFGKGLLNLNSSGSGLTFAIGIADELRATLNALEQQNKANILSSPHVLASDNREARIDVSTEVPTVTASTVIPSGGQSVTTTTVQYRDTGVLLAVTPHINERGLVTMDVFQEVSEQSADVVVAGDAFPSFFKRVVQTSLTVQHGQTIVLGGLIRENKSKTSSGVPWLARLPIIGFIFGQTQDAFDKTELIILLTPKVIVNLDDVDIVTDEFKLKVNSVVRDMYEKLSVQ